MLLFVAVHIVNALPERIRRKLLSVGAVVFIIGSVFATISAQKSGCPGGEPNDDGTGEIAGLLIPSRMVNDAALLRNMSDAESDSEEGAALCLTNRISFDSFSITSTSRVFGIGWSQGLSLYFPLLDLAYKQELTNDEWSVFMTEDIGGSMTNGIVLEIATDQMPTNAVADKAFYVALMRKDPNPLRNTDGDYFTDIEELGEANIISSDGYLWFDIALTGSDLLFPYYQRADLEADVDFQSPHVFNGIAYSGARVTLDGWVYFKDAALARINTDSCPSVRLFGIEPMADAWNWGSGVYFGTVVNDGRTYDVIEYLDIGMYDYIDEPVSPLISCEVIIPRSEPDTIYVSYANVDDEIRNVDSWLGYANTALESVFVSNGYYQIEYPVGTSRPVPYTTVRYHIGTGTDPRVYDDYTPPVCGQTAVERALVETSVGHNLTNGLYELTASVTEDPVVPVRITVGDRSVTMTNCGECVFLCEKGVQYQLAVSPSFFSSVEFSARDDIAPPMMAGAGGSAGAVWTVDNRLTLVPPSGSAFGSCLWLPTFTAGPNALGHWYPDDGGMRFTAYLTDYPGSNSVSYAWSCADENVHIASPSSESTMVSLRNSPGWGSTDLSVTATVDGYTLSSTLANLEYGEHTSPEVCLELDAPAAVLLNSNEVSAAKLRRFELRFRSDIPTNGLIRLQLLGNTSAVKLWTTTNRTSRIPNTKTWEAAEFTEFAGYVEGVNTSSTLGDVTMKAQFLSSGTGDDIVQQQQMTVACVNDVEVIGEPLNGLVVLANVIINLKVDVKPYGVQEYLITNWKLRCLLQDGNYSEWQEGLCHGAGCGWGYASTSGGVFQVCAEVFAGDSSSGLRFYKWKNDEDGRVGLCKCGDKKSVGIVEEQWQQDLLDNVHRHIGQAGYGFFDVLPPMYMFAGLGDGVWKCNMFVAHRIRETSGIDVEWKHVTLSTPIWLPPLANEWAGNEEIDSWHHPDGNCVVQPGWIIAHPNPNPNNPGHVGIVDFDGAGIAAGAETVNRLYKLWYDGTSQFRRYENE